MLFDTLLPMDTIMAISSGVHSSSVRDRTRDMCEPSILWTPEHSMQSRQPMLREAHSGSGGEQQAWEWSNDKMEEEE